MKKHTFKEGDYVRFKNGPAYWNTFCVAGVERNGDTEVEDCVTGVGYDLCKQDEFVKAKKPKTMNQLLSELRAKFVRSTIGAMDKSYFQRQTLAFQREAFKIYDRYK